MIKRIVINAGPDNVFIAADFAYYHGGVVGDCGSGTIRGCVSAATLTVASGLDRIDNYGGIVGLFLGNMSDCLAIGASVPAVNDNGAIAGFLDIEGGVTLTNCYYYNCTVGNAVNQSDAYTVSAGTDVTVAPADDVNPDKTYDYNGIKRYDTDLYYGGVLYVPTNEVGAYFRLTLSTTIPTESFTGYAASAGTLTGTENPYTLTMPAGDVTVELKGVSYLSESAGITNVNDILGNTARFIRTFTAGKASTICLPFPMTSVVGGSVYTFTGIDYDDVKAEWVATMTDATPNGSSITTTVANTPYLFMPDGNGEVTFTGTVGSVAEDIVAGSTTSTDTYWTFRGTYTRLDYGTAPMTGYVYGFAAKDKTVDGHDIVAGQFIRAKSGAYLPAFRAYLTYSGSDDTFRAPGRDVAAAAQLPDRITVRLLSYDGTVTAVGTMDTVTGDVTIEHWFDMNGRPVDGEPSEPGMYLNDKGKKVLIK